MEDKVYKKNINFRVRNIAKQDILFGEGTDAYQLNETGILIWENINGRNNLTDIKKEILKNYEVDNKKLSEDVVDFLNFLVEIDAVKEV